MATLTRGQTFGSTETVTNTKLHNLVDLGGVSNIVDADCSASMNLTDTKLADITTGNKVRGSALGNLASIPSGAGTIPSINIPVLGATMLSLASIPNSSLLPLTLTSWVDGAAMRNIQSMPSLAGQLSWYSIVTSIASGSGVIFNGVDKFIAGQQGAPYQAGDFTILSAITERSTTGTSYSKVKELTALGNGVYRIVFDLKNSSGTNEGAARIYKNGSAFGTERFSVGVNSYTTYSEDLSFNSGDLIQIYYKSITATTTYVRNMYMRLAGTD